MPLLRRTHWRVGAALAGAAALAAGVLSVAAPASAQDAPASAAAAPKADATRTPYKAAYNVKLSTDAAGVSWTGTQSITFSNASTDPLTEVYLRLWDNWRGGCNASQPIKITNFTGGTLAPLTVNCTAGKVTLPKALAKDESATVSFSLSIVAPNISDRFGRNGAYNYFGNALPVLAVKDGAGWHLDPYADTGESFYALASDYTVVLDHPTAMKTPATGIRSEVGNGPGRTLTTTVGKQVREFAWADGPYQKSSTTANGGVAVNTYWTSDLSASTGAQMQSVSVSALNDYGSKYGQFPYGEMDVVIDGTLPFGGMEYPGVVFDVPSQNAAAHEIGHQWFYGIVGNDEYRAPWLDESFTTYITDRHFGDEGSGCSINWSTSAEKMTNTMAYWDSRGGPYSAVIYDGGSCTLHDLRRTLGGTAMDKLMADYAKSHWYGVSTTADFKAAAQAATTVNLTSFWTSHRVEG
ncbi:MAG: peptidase [Actinomycetia bacterium]|nr:peptidase [Actinomycetes bacterium]